MERACLFSNEVATVETLDQRYVMVPATVKDAFLVQILTAYQEKHPKGLIIIFTATCKSVKTEVLNIFTQTAV